MKKFWRLNLILLLFFSITACSFSPGVPGLAGKSSRYEKTQREGVDYKLVIINRNIINNQKPFDYVSYIRNKKKRHASYQSKSLQKNISNHKTAAKYNNQKRSPDKSNRSYENIIPSGVYSEITSKDIKSNYRYLIGKRDVLSITVWDHPELTIPAGDAPATHVVGNDGRFYFPYGGKIQAAGKTVDAVREKLENKLKSFIAKPQVSVRVAQYRSQKAYISGAINKPSTLVINDLPLTVRDAISKAGGVVPRKFTGIATLTRGNQTINIDLNRMLKFNDNSQNFIVKNRDRLHVQEIDKEAEFREGLSEEVRTQYALNPIRLKFELQKERELATLRKELERELKTEQAKVFVMGEVTKPGSVKYLVEDGMTLAEAINDAGSLKEDSVNPKGIFVVRQENSRDKIPTVYQLPISSVHSMLLAEQFTIRPRDIVYVTATPSIRWNRVLGLLLPSLTILNTIDNLTNN